MEITETKERDKKLLRLNPFKKERMVIRILTKQNIVLESKVITGTKDSVSSTEQMIGIIKELVYQSQKRNLLVDKIEIGHTHKTKKHKNGLLQVGELSTRDKECAVYLKQIFSYPLQMNVITGLGFTLTEEF